MIKKEPVLRGVVSNNHYWKDDVCANCGLTRKYELVGLIGYRLRYYRESDGRRFRREIGCKGRP